MPIFHHAKAWEEYGKEYAVHKELWKGCVLATIGPQSDKGDKARDLTGHRNHGTLTNGPVWNNDSIRGNGFRQLFCSGVNSGLVVTSPASIPLGSSARTVSAWIRVNSWGDNSVVCEYGSLGGFGYRAAFFVLKDSSYKPAYDRRLAYEIYGTTACSTTQITEDTWVHVAYTNVGTTAVAGGMFYLNGRADGSNLNDGIDMSLATVASDLCIGRFILGDRTSDCNVADVRLYRRVLLPSEISILARHPLAAYEVRLPEFFFGVSTAVALTVAGSAVSVTSDSPTLTQHNTLAVGNAVCSVTSGNVALVQHSALTVQSSQLATSSQSPALTQHNALTVGNASVGLTSQQPTLTQHSALTIGSSICVVSSGTVALTQHGALTVQSATCTVVSENVVLTAHAPAVVTLTVQGSTCVISSTSPVLTQHGALIVASSQCLVSSGNVTLAYHAAGAALILEHQTLLLAI